MESKAESMFGGSQSLESEAESMLRGRSKSGLSNGIDTVLVCSLADCGISSPG